MTLTPSLSPSLLPQSSPHFLMVTAIQVDVSESETDSRAESEDASPSGIVESEDHDLSKRCSVNEYTPAQEVPEQKRSAPDKSRKNPFSSEPQLRRSRRNTATLVLQDLARHIVSSKPVVFITGAGLSAPSGIRAFRGPDGLWSEVIWRKATREEFRKDPLRWYNDFWLKHFPPHTYGQFYEPNGGHEAIATLANLPKSNIKVITQNIDGLHCRTRQRWNHEDQLIESHGRLGYYKCIPEEDSDSDSDSDEDNTLHQRSIKLGNRRKRQMLQSCRMGSPCRYEFAESIPANNIEPYDVRAIISGMHYGIGNAQHSVDSDHELALQLQSYINGDGHTKRGDQYTNSLQCSQTLIKEPPQCPACRRPALPQALLFDESYHSHDHYQFERMEDWIEASSVIVFIGTSFAVTLTQQALDHARKEKKIIYNFNIDGDVLDNSSWMSIENVVGDVQRTLPELVRLCNEEIAAARNI